jgi:hypothetical protein
MEKVVEFFKGRKTVAKVGPKITVSYAYTTYSFPMDDVEVALHQQWEVLRPQLDQAPNCIKKTEWRTYRVGERQEHLSVEIEGVLMELEGPYYPDPDYVAKPEERDTRTEEERANDMMDQMLQRTDWIWILEHCSTAKYHSFLDFVQASRLARTRRGSRND